MKGPFICLLLIPLFLISSSIGCNHSSQGDIKQKVIYPWQLSNKEYFHEVDRLRDAAIIGDEDALHNLGWLSMISDTERGEYLGDAFIKVIESQGIKTVCSQLKALPIYVRNNVLTVAFGHDGVSEKRFEYARKRLGVEK